jgi:hypothetical protein
MMDGAALDKLQQLHASIQHSFVAHHETATEKASARKTPTNRVPTDNPPVLYTSLVIRTAPPELATGSETFGIPGICLPNLVPGGYDGLPRSPRRKERTPKKQKLTTAQWQELFLWKSDAED